MVGGYSINVVAGGNLPQKVASGFTEVFSNMVGASYEPLAYLGEQVVNGKNHAILCKQTLITGQDITNVALVILNEKPGDMHGETFSIVEIRVVVSDSGKKLLGTMRIAPTTDIPADAKEVFDKHFGGFLGAKNKAFALLGTNSSIRGGEYLFAVESEMLVGPNSMASGTKSVNLVTVYGDFDEIKTEPILVGTAPEGMTLKVSYSFQW